MRKVLILLGCFMFLSSTIFAQYEDDDLENNKTIKQDSVKKNVLSSLKFTSYIQTQFQLGEKLASLRVGNDNTDLNKSFNRFGIRRGRVKMIFEKGIATGVFQLDITEKGIGVKEAFINIADLIKTSSSFRVGVFNRPFGYEVNHSSSKRASPERANIITTLFPEERDLGAMLTLQAPKTSAWHNIKLDLALIAGNGIKIDMDSKKDFIAHISFQKKLHKQTNISGGIAYYRGFVYQGSANVYSMKDKKFVVNTNTNNLGAFAKREYFGADVQFTTTTNFGETEILAEYIFGTQPGEKDNSKSPNYTTLPTHDTYIRNFAGAYISLLQALGNTPLYLIVKYDFYDPNKKVAKNDIGLFGTDKGDIAYNTWGVGLLWKINNQLKLTSYYDWISNEKTNNLTGFEKNLADNMFTLRLQFKF